MDVKAALSTQYHAALTMLREAIEKCPDDLWGDGTPKNAFWHVAYHALFYGHLYLMPDESAFTPFEGHRADHQYLGGTPEPPHRPVELGEPYTKVQMLGYCDQLDGMVDAVLETVDLTSETCGFWWYEMRKLDHEILSIRHIQHHAAQLADRLRNHADEGVRWRG